MKTTIIMSILSVLGFASPEVSFDNLDADEFEKLIYQENIQILDVRTPDEYAAGHIPNSINIDINEKDFREEVEKKISKDASVAVYCRSGRRSANACSLMTEWGYRTFNLKEGIIAWTEGGKPLTKISLEMIAEFIRKCGHYFIATVENGDQARVRPFGTVNIYNGKIYIQTGHVKNVAKQISEYPKVELCCFDGQKWLRLSGTLVEDTSIEAKKSMLDAYPDLRKMYDENDDNTAVYYFTEATARFCSFTEPEEDLTFGTSTMLSPSEKDTE